MGGVAAGSSLSGLILASLRANFILVPSAPRFIEVSRTWYWWRCDHSAAATDPLRQEVYPVRAYEPGWREGSGQPGLTGPAVGVLIDGSLRLSLVLAGVWRGATARSKSRRSSR